MFKELHRRAKALEHRLNQPDYSDLSDPEHRRRARRHSHLMDHAFLRVWWTNFYKVADGVYRCNQPSPRQLERYHARGIRAVLNLRGRSDMSYYLFERETCERLGMEMVDLRLFSRDLPPAETFEELERVFRTIPRPFIMHCKSGADRAGLASALYLMMIEGAPVKVAARQLHWRFVHLKSTKTGVLDHFLRVYERAHRRSGIGLMDWIRTGYDPAEISASFRDWQKGRWDPK